METAGFNPQLSAHGTAGLLNHPRREAGYAGRGVVPRRFFFILLALSTLPVTVRRCLPAYKT